MRLVGGMRTRQMRRAGAFGLLVAALLTICSAGTSARAQSAEVFENQFIRVTSYLDDQMTTLTPGGSADWIISIEPLVPSTGTLTVGFALASDPTAAAGLDVTVAACSVAWVNAVCPAGEQSWQPQAPAASAFTPVDLAGVAHRVGVVPVTAQSAPTWLRLRVLPSAALNQQALAQFLVAVQGQGEPIIATPGAGLAKVAKTGVDADRFGVAGLIALLLGAFIVVVGTRGKRRGPAAQAASHLEVTVP